MTEYLQQNWLEYFRHRDEGLGTTYERFVLIEIFKKIRGLTSVASVLEAPSFGVTGISGINSLWWAVRGAHVVVADHHSPRLKLIKGVWEELGLKADFMCLDEQYTLPFKTKCFDLVWSFNALEHVLDLDEFLAEAARVCRSILFFCLPNPHALITRLQRTSLLRRNTYYLEKMDAETIKTKALHSGWRLLEQGYFDSPPWPDIAMKKEDLLKKTGLPTGMIAAKKGVSIVEYFSGEDHDLPRRVLRYAVTEKLPLPLKRLWAHHRYLIFRPHGE